MLQPAGSPLRPQVVQIPKPPPGFSHAAPLLDCTVRSCQYHWPPTLKSSRACTETQYVPGDSTAAVLRLMTKSILFELVYGWFIAAYTCVPGRPPESW